MEQEGRLSPVSLIYMGALVSLLLLLPVQNQLQELPDPGFLCIKVKPLAGQEHVKDFHSPHPPVPGNGNDKRCSCSAPM